MKRVAWLLALAACGGATDPTEIVVEVRSDLSVPSDMDELHVRVANDGDFHFDERYPLGTGPSQITLPRRLTLVPEGGGTPTVTVEVSASQGGREVVSRRAVLPFVLHQSVYLRLDLVSACLAPTCLPGTTCVAGACVTEVVDPAALPRFTPKQPIEPLSPAQDAAGSDGPAADSSGSLDGGADGCRNCTTEVCTNGVDDDGDGDVDCADSDCGRFACTSTVPPGWNGPAAFFAGTPSNAPACSAPFGNMAYQGRGNLTCPAATCSSCSCGAPKDVTCAPPPLTWFGSSCGSGAAGSTSTGCTRAGAVDEGHLDVGPAGPASGGACVPSGGDPSRVGATWGASATACAPQGLLTGGCRANQLCAPRPGSPFESRLCIWAAGALPCPSGYDHDRRVFYSGASDTRACAACTCGDPTGVSCGGTVLLYSDASCPADAPASAPLGATCFDAGKNTQATRYMPATSGGSCSAGGGQPSGDCEPTGPTTVCCGP
jgi:hypothetical protein